MVFKQLLRKTKPVDIESIKSDFVSLSSHQLRTPLSAVKWYAELMLSKKAGKLNEKQEQYLRQIYRSNDRAINLVNDLLDVSRIQQGQIHLEFRPTKVETIIAEAQENLYDLIKAGKIAIDYEIVGGPLPSVNTDPEKLKRIMSNIIGNAIRYTPAGGKVRIAAKKDKDFIVMAVSDTGVGIPEADKKKIFDKFFRSQNAMRLAPDGTGLGLFITKSLIGAMGGKISFESEEGKGTTFRLSLPLT